MAGDKQPESSSTASRLSRRRVIEMSAAGAAALAGCEGRGPDDGTGNGNGNGNGNGGTGAVTTELASHFPAWEPSNTNINRFAPEGNEPPFLTYLWFEGTLLNNNSGDIVYFTIDEVEFDDGGQEILIHFKEGYTWWDGSALTAEDYLIQRKINQFQQYGSPEEAPFTVELEDEYTARESRDTPVNPATWMLGHIQALQTKRSRYREFLEQYEDAGSQSAVEQVTEDLTTHQIGFEEAVEDGFGASLFKPTEWNPTRVTWEKVEDHPRADWTNLETWTWELVSGAQTVDQAFMDNRFDMGELQFDLVEQHDQIENVRVLPLPGVPKLTMNFHNTHLARRGVRRAIAYLIDHDEVREVIRANFGTPYEPHPDIDGMARPVGENWVGLDFLENLIDYGSTAQPEQARQALRDAGYTKDGEFWVGPDGAELSGLKYITPPWGIYEQINRYLAPKLSEFGIGTESVLPSRSNFYQRLNETFEFDLVNWFHVGFHPTTSYEVGEQFGPTGLDNYRSVAEPVDDFRATPELSADTSERLNHPIRPTFPSEVGSLEVSGSGETLYPIKWHNILGATQDESEIVDVTRKLASYYNWQLPHVGFYEEVWNTWARTDKYTFEGNHPDSETERTEREHTIVNEDAFQVKLGHVSSKPE